MKLFIKIIKITLILLFLFVLLICGAFFIIFESYKAPEYTKTKDYPKALAQIVNKEEVKHFPKEIPPNASKIKLFGYSDLPYNGEMLMLEFKIDKPYIEKEFNSYEFVNKNDKPGTVQKIYYMPKEFHSQSYTYYVLKTPDNLSYYKEYFPYSNGIGIDIKHNKILYYYISPSE